MRRLSFFLAGVVVTSFLLVSFGCGDSASSPKARGDRVALVELFTGADCPPCVAADMAFDELLENYGPGDVVLVQYHLHIPRFDPLTNDDAEGRMHYYGIHSTPQMRIDGRQGPGVGGRPDMAHRFYTTLVGKLGDELASNAAGSLTVTAQRDGERIDMTAEAGGLTRGPLRLRLLLIEDAVHYEGSNGQSLHHHVVRACPGGVEGKAVTPQAARHQATVNLAELRESLREEAIRKKKPEGPVELQRLKVVALLQDDDSKEVVQAAQVDVPEK